MSAESDAEAVLAGFQPIGEDHPQVRGFEDAVRARIAERGGDLPSRPSPSRPASDGTDALLAQISGQLDDILSILRGGSS